MHAAPAILEYIRRAQSLSTLLTHSIQLTNPSDDFIKSSQEDLKYLDGALEDSTQDFAKEPYRRKLKIVRYRLKQKLQHIRNLRNKTEKSANHAYASERELLRDLHLIRDSLISDEDTILLDLSLIHI